jgi:exportin-7
VLLPQEIRLAEQALQLCTRCLNFDFIGTNPDESAEDVGTIQVPNTWRSVIQDPATMTLLLDFYKSTQPPSSKEALQSIILLSSVRRSLFATDKERAAFLQQLVTAIREVLQTEQGLNYHDNYHEFCRLLGRLKANYQLCELVRTEGFNEWLNLAAAFTVKSFQQWQYFGNSIHYLLALWGRLIAAIPYVPQANGGTNYRDNMQHCVLQVRAKAGPQPRPQRAHVVKGPCFSDVAPGPTAAVSPLPPPCSLPQTTGGAGVP